MRIRLCLAAALGLLAGAAAAGDTLTILHTNDFHARFAPVDQNGRTCRDSEDAAGKCLGGAARLATAIAAARAGAEESVLLDGGDWFQGTLFYSHYKGELAAGIMTRLGYDAMAAGNHEFDDGPGGLADFIAAVDFPVLSANTEAHGAPRLARGLEKSVVIARGGARLGLIGLTPQDTGMSSSPGAAVGFTDPVAAVERQVAQLTAAGVERIILLSHSGYDVDLRLAREVPGLDVIVGGHSHTFLADDAPGAAGPYPTMVGDTAVVQAAAHGRVLGELVVTFDAEGRVTRATGAPRLLGSDMAEDAGVKARIAAAAKPLERMRSRVVGAVAAPVAGGAMACRTGECAIGNMVAEAMLARVRDEGIDAALQNGGGLRAGLDAGPVTMGELREVLPFGNRLSIVRVTGAALLAALENGVSRIARGGGRFPQVAGMRFVVDPAAPPGDRVREVTVAGTPLAPEREYGVVTNGFLRDGGDGYVMFRAAPGEDEPGADIAEVTADYLARNSPYAPATDGRIRLTGE